MDLLTLILTVAGLSVFEIISSIDNAIINADVLATMQERYRKWFLVFGIISSVFIVRGLLPWLIVWLSTPGIGPIDAFIASFSNNPEVLHAIEQAAPFLLIAGGVYLIFLFFHWYFLESKEFGLIGERFISKQGVWFYAIVAILLTVIVWLALHQQPFMAFGAVLGSTVFFITHGFKQNAEQQEKNLKNKHLSDVSKIMYLEVIDATFSIDGVLGAFAFTLSVPLILIGNGIGAIVVRQLTIKGVDKIKRYAYLKNGAMYSILCLGTIMVLDSFNVHIPFWVSPVATFSIVGYFLYKSVRANKMLS